MLMMRSLIHSRPENYIKIRTRGYKKSCLTHQSMKFIMLINVKMPSIDVILTLISMTVSTSEHLKAIKVFIFQHFKVYEQ